MKLCVRFLYSQLPFMSEAKNSYGVSVALCIFYSQGDRTSLDLKLASYCFILISTRFVVSLAISMMKTSVGSESFTRSSPPLSLSSSHKHS